MWENESFQAWRELDTHDRGEGYSGRLGLPNVFLSYDSRGGGGGGGPCADLQFARALANAFEDAGVTCFGEWMVADQSEAVSTRLATCTVCVSLLSPGYFASTRCRGELRAALDRQKTEQDAAGHSTIAIIPIFLQHVPTEALEADGNVDEAAAAIKSLLPQLRGAAVPADDVLFVGSGARHFLQNAGALISAVKTAALEIQAHQGEGTAGGAGVPTALAGEPSAPPQSSSAVVCGVCRKWFGNPSALKSHYKSDMHVMVVDELWATVEEVYPPLEVDDMYESDSSTEETEQEAHAAAQVFQRAVAIASSAGSSWRSFATDCNTPTPGDPVWAKLGLNSMYYPARVAALHGPKSSVGGDTAEPGGAPPISQAKVQFDSGEELHVALRDVIAPQRLVVGQAVLAPRWSGGYCFPAVVCGHSLMPTGSAEGYQVEFDAVKGGGGSRRTLVHPSDIVVPGIDAATLAEMRSTRVRSAIAVSAAEALAHVVDLIAPLDASTLDGSADGQAASALLAVDATHGAGAGAGVAAVTPSGPVAPHPAPPDASASSSDPAPTSSLGAVPMQQSHCRSSRVYCAVCFRSDLPELPLFPCACGQFYHTTCVTAAWGAGGASWSSCPTCVAVPHSWRNRSAWSGRNEAGLGGLRVKREADMVGSSLIAPPMQSKRRRRLDDDTYVPDFDPQLEYEADERPIYDGPDPLLPKQKSKRIPWTPEELSTVMRMDAEGHNGHAIAAVLGRRTPAAVTVRIWLLKNKK